MKITSLEATVVSVPYTHKEVSSRIVRGGVTDVVVKLTADNGLVGWGESCGTPNAASIKEAVIYARHFVLGRSPWDKEAIAAEYFGRGVWNRRASTGNFAFAGIDQALWDLCAKSCGQPLYQLLGGALRDEVEYFYYLSRGEPEDIARQGAEGRSRGYRSYYLKVGVDRRAEEAMLEALRSTVGPEARIRIDANEAWSLNEAIKILTDWDRRYDIDFCEAPVRHDLPESLAEIRARVPCAISANEALAREVDVVRLIRSRSADVLCFSPYWVGSLRRFVGLSHLAHLEGLIVCKHSHGELGIAAAACQHAMLCLPNADPGNQQTATMMVDDILKEPVPISTGPRWGRICGHGLGIEVDEDKVARFHQAYLRDGQFLPFQPASR